MDAEQTKIAVLIAAFDAEQARLQSAIAALNQTGAQLSQAVGVGAKSAVTAALQELQPEIGRASGVLAGLQRFSLWPAAAQHAVVALMAMLIALGAVWWYVPPIGEITARRPSSRSSKPPSRVVNSAERRWCSPAVCRRSAYAWRSMKRRARSWIASSGRAIQSLRDIEVHGPEI